MSQLIQAGEGYVKEGVTIKDLLQDGIDLTHYKNVISANPKIKGDLPELEKEKFSIFSQVYKWIIQSFVLCLTKPTH